MPYAEGRVIHDADAHIMEMPGFLADHLEAKYREPVTDTLLFPRREGFHSRLAEAERAKARRSTNSQIMLAKNWAALGSCAPPGPAALDRPAGLLEPAHVHHGAAQLLQRAGERHRTTTSPTPWRGRIRGTWSSSARSTAACCRPATCRCSTSSAPPRPRARRSTLGAKALMIPSRCPDGHSPSHIGFDPLWAMAQEAGLPIVFHVGGGGKLARAGLLQQRPAAGAGFPWRRRQLPLARLHGDRLRADEGADRADRRPRARPLPAASSSAVIEQGASWVPGWMRNMDCAHNAFYKNEERLQKMSLKPSEFVKPPGARHALPARGYRLDHRQLGRRGLPVLVRLPACRGRPPSDQALRGVDGRPPASTRRRSSASIATTSSTSWAAGLA